VVLAFSTVINLKNFQIVFAGLDNFKQALTNDMEFFPALYSSLLDLVNIPIVITYALLMAILLNKKFKGRGFFRVIFILPLLLGSSVIMDSLQGNHAEVAVSMGVTGQSVADTVTNSFQDILLNHQLQTFFGERLSGYVGNIINRISSVMWISSIQIIIFLGALQNIPQSLYEAAEIDGASEFEKFWKITLPMVMPSVELNVVFTVINSFTSSDNALMTYISNVSFKNLMLSYGSAMAWMYFLLVGIIMAVILMVIRKIAKQYES
jgi:ABC-type sugar transport system permease subunit